MTDFSLSVEVDHTPGSQYHNDGRATLKLVLDPESAKAFYEWMADGCERDLLVSRDGLAYPKKTEPLNFIPVGAVPLAKELSDEKPRVKK